VAAEVSSFGEYGEGGAVHPLGEVERVAHIQKEGVRVGSRPLLSCLR